MRKLCVVTVAGGFTLVVRRNATEMDLLPGVLAMQNNVIVEGGYYQDDVWGWEEVVVDRDVLGVAQAVGTPLKLIPLGRPRQNFGVIESLHL